ncbi:hypothetical protein M0813_11011 [Anaeramoeba flamelloides]|uniref:Uncharacterized protein n=1 Tax=Anaeramoeba flamelloides TaxID=1746091 RepID=A0ABQ8X1L6_9EUKA|nr:hypothetical protein M0813_11011 [Anaeramoeba flamelloides]
MKNINFSSELQNHPELARIKTEFQNIKSYNERFGYLMKLLPHCFSGLKERQLTKNWIHKYSDAMDHKGPKKVKIRKDCISDLSQLTHKSRRTIERGVNIFMKKNYGLSNCSCYSRDWLIFAKKNIVDRDCVERKKRKRKHKRNKKDTHKKKFSLKNKNGLSKIIFKNPHPCIQSGKIRSHTKRYKNSEKNKQNLPNNSGGCNLFQKSPKNNKNNLDFNTKPNNNIKLQQFAHKQEPTPLKIKNKKFIRNDHFQNKTAKTSHFSNDQKKVPEKNTNPFKYNRNLGELRADVDQVDFKDFRLPIERIELINNEMEFFDFGKNCLDPTFLVFCDTIIKDPNF